MGGDSEGSNEREREERESPSSHPEERGGGGKVEIIQDKGGTLN